MKKLGTLLLTLFCVVIIAYIGISLSRFNHYARVEEDGRLRATVSVTGASPNLTPNSPIQIHFRIANLGSQDWKEEEHYFALGLFERDWLGRRVVSNVKIFPTGGKSDVENADRIRLPKNLVIPTGKNWDSDFLISVPPGNHSVLFQMVQEGVTWFGQEQLIDLRTK